MGIHSHHHFVEHEVGLGNGSTERRTFRVSLNLLGTLMGGALLLNSLLAKWLFEDEDLAGLMAMVGAVLLAAPVVWHAAKGLLTGHTHMDELVALAIIASFALKHYYEAGAVAFFMLIAELIEARTALGARASIESLIRITPTRAHLISAGGAETETEAKLLQPGQKIRVRPGDNIPADGRVIAGESTVNQANITGESLPVDKTLGDKVFAGTNNLTGVMDVEVTTAGRDTTLGRVQSLILQAEATKIPIMRIIDQYIHWYIPTILMIAAIVWAFKDMEVVITLLIIACPCALILATPTAMVAALSCAARMGILVKNVADLEAAGRLNAMVFDKTGTLTTGELAVTKLTPAPGVEAADMLTAAASVEQNSRHPVAKAVVDVAKRARIKLSRAEQFEEVAGRGVKARLDGKTLLVGRENWLIEQGVDMSILRQENMAAPEGVSLLYVARNNRCLGWIGLEDRTREEARAATTELRELGLKRLVMVTGDRLAVAQRVAAEMGCNEVKAECLPHEKLHLVHELQREGYQVAVVGDGVNDAPALAAGDLGVAMGAAGSDVAINSASIALMNNDLRRLSFLVRLSRVTRRVVNQNLIFGVLFIIIGAILAISGELKAIPAVILHVVGSLIIIFNSARLVRFGEEQTDVINEDDVTAYAPAKTASVGA
ncbi:MAG: cadmium-translocating P-type ATPase [Sedimentisphaerales bacterium]|nr:cadmium-translocating P-type ATPase [Sedimentisphaerales bacterium]